ncbi:SDR family NAD(P)-dependent oxidoreductase [Nocardia sp. NPDC004068]|uniref:SDR family NAD(P)-dependent oxidoreductase n=1 Tax=Nocardia sp. NPDC004068 TaxID=3364303 RepID=UPI0036893B06
MPHLVVFGAGPALGLSAALRFGRAGYTVTLVARNPDTTADLRRALAGADVETDVLHANLTDDAQVDAALTELVARHGIPDVALYAPGDVSRLPVPALALDADTLRTWLPLHLLTPVRLLHALLPGMVERGSGAVLFAQGDAIRTPQPALASVSVPQSGLLNLLHAVDREARPRGVRVGSLQISRLIERSAAQRLFDSGHYAEVEPNAVGRVNPDELAETLFEMATTDTAVELAA